MNQPNYLKTVYHVTTVKNWRKIAKTGLKTQIGKLSQKIGEDEKAIYTFPSLNELDNALMNWLGEEYEEMEEELDEKIELAILEVDVSSFKFLIKTDSNGEIFFEQKILENIPPEFIRLLRIE